AKRRDAPPQISSCEYIQLLLVVVGRIDLLHAIVWRGNGHGKNDMDGFVLRWLLLVHGTKRRLAAAAAAVVVQTRTRRWCRCRRGRCWSRTGTCARSATRGSSETRTCRCTGGGTRCRGNC
ncbi:Os09g0449400, partial [Oryza sativa Japonica Group]